MDDGKAETQSKKSLKLKRPRATPAQTNKKTKNPEKSTSSEESSGDRDTDQFDFDTTLEELNI